MEHCNLFVCHSWSKPYVCVWYVSWRLHLQLLGRGLAAFLLVSRCSKRTLGRNSEIGTDTGSQIPLLPVPIPSWDMKFYQKPFPCIHCFGVAQLLLRRPPTPLTWMCSHRLDSTIWMFRNLFFWGFSLTEKLFCIQSPVLNSFSNTAKHISDSAVLDFVWKYVNDWF